MSIQSPVGTLDIKNATLRVGKLEVSNIQGVDTALNVTRANSVLIYDDQASTTTFTGTTSSAGVRDTVNGYLDVADGYVYWGQKLPNAWVMDFEMDIRSGTNAGPLYANVFSTTNTGGDGYSFTFNDSNDKISLYYDGTLLTEATVTGLFTATENWQKVVINYERGMIAISLGGSRKFYYKDIERETPYVNGEYVSFSSASTDGRKIRDLRIVNGEKWMYTGESNIAYTQGSVGVGVTDPQYTLDVAGDINLSGNFYQGGAPFVSSLWTDGADSLYYRSNVEVGTGNLFVDTTTSRVGINTTTPGYDLDVNGDINFTGTFYQGGSPFVSSLWTSGNDSLYYTASNVGIGTDTAEYTLDVHGNANVGALTTTSVSGDGSALYGIQSSNVSDFASNVTRIGTLETDLGSNATRIGTLETDLGSNATRIGTLETDLSDNSSRITSIESGTHTFTGIKTFESDVILESNLMVNGDLLVANTVHMIVSDPIMELGANNLNTGDLGIIMTRHGESGNVAIIFDESTDTLEIGYTTGNHMDTTITIDDSSLFHTNIHGNVSVSNLNIGQFSVVPSYGLDHVTNENNSTGDTLISTNATTGLQTSANVSVGRDALVSGNVEVSQDLTVTGNIAVDTDTLFVDATTDRVGVGTTSPIAALDIVGGAEDDTTPALSIRGGIYDTSDLYVLNTYNVATDIGYAAKVIGVNIKNKVETDNTIQVRNNIGGLTAAGAIYLGSDDVNQGIFGVLGADGVAGTTLTEHLTVRAGGNVGIGTASPNTLLELSKATGSATISPTELRLTTTTNAADWDTTNSWARLAFYTNDITGDAPGVMASVGAVASSVDGGENTRLAFFTAEPHLERMCVDRYGNVGIGTTSPARAFEIAKTGGSAIINLKRTDTGTGQGALAFVNTYSNVAASISCLRSGAEGGELVFRTVLNDTTQTSDNPYQIPERMRIDSSGNVGIGTDSPNRQLQIYGNSSNFFSFSPAEADDTTVDDKTNFGATSFKKQMMMRLNDRTWYWGLVNNASNYLGLGADGGGGDDPDIQCVFQNDGTFWTKNIRTSGNVGIGTTNPTYKLNILTDTNYDGISLRDSTRELLKISKGNNGSYINMFESGASKVNIATAGVSYLNGGNVGIGTATPYAKLHVNGASGVLSSASRAYFSYFDSSSALVQYNTGTWGNMSIYGSGNIAAGLYFVSHGGTISASDIRIKKNIVDADDAECLETLRLLKPKKYQYKDAVARGEEPVWGFIAQEVRETLPHATQLRQDVLPNIYELANVSQSNVITFTNFNTSNLESNATTLIRTTGIDGEDHDIHLAEVIDEHTIRVEEDLSEWTGSVDAEGNVVAGNQLFIYGQEVDDFVFVKKEAIWTVATSALQEVDRQQRADKVRIAELETQLTSVLARLDALESA